MCIEKFLALYFPLKVKVIFTIKPAKIVTSIAAFIPFAYALQYLFSYKVVSIRVYELCLLRSWRSAKVDKILNRIDSTLYSYAPFTIMIITNCAIIYKFMKAKLRSNNQQGTDSTNQALSKYAAKGTTTSTTVSTTFILLTGLTSFTIVVTNNPHRVLFASYMFLLYLNHSINGLLYSIVGSRLRKELIDTLWRGKK